MTKTTKPDAGYSGLLTAQPTLSTAHYIEPSAFLQDLQAIWYRNWIYVCQSGELPGPRDYRLLKLGDQELVVLRDEHHSLQAFHNTCRHRGSILFTEPAGTLRSDSITCPYHAWNYSLQGELKRTPSHFCQQGFDPTALSLYDIAVTEWRGMVFINLAGNEAASIESGMDCGGEALANWPLETLQVGHVMRKEMACNWKIFWENFNECLHCPGIHPELSRLVPLYRRSLMEVKDDPNWVENSAKDNPRFKGGLAPGVHTWSADGQPCDSPFADLDEQQKAQGHTYEVLLPTMFIVGHVDYVRIVSLLPVAPERTALESRWLFRPETLARKDFKPAEFAAFAELVLEQDANAAELNQKGLHCVRHQHGTLMAEEYDVHAFQNWVRDQLAQRQP